MGSQNPHQGARTPYLCNGNSGGNFFKPDAESAADFYQTVKPEATPQEAAAWSDLLYGDIILYSMAKETIKMVRGADSLTPEFYHTAATRLARAMILEAGLPLPSDLK